MVVHRRRASRGAHECPILKAKDTTDSPCTRPLDHHSPPPAAPPFVHTSPHTSRTPHTIPHLEVPGQQRQVRDSRCKRGERRRTAVLQLRRGNVQKALEPIQLWRLPHARHAGQQCRHVVTAQGGQRWVQHTQQVLLQLLWQKGGQVWEATGVTVRSGVWGQGREVGGGRPRVGGQGCDWGFGAVEERGGAVWLTAGTLMFCCLTVWP